MGLSINEYIYEGGERVFPATFAFGYDNPAHVFVYVLGEVDGEGAQVYRDYTWESSSEIRVTNSITIGDMVAVARTVPKASLPVYFTEPGSMTRENLDLNFRRSVHLVQEFLDGRYEGTSLGETRNIRDAMLEMQAAAAASAAAALASENDASASEIAAAASAAASEAALLSYVTVSAGIASDIVSQSNVPIYSSAEIVESYDIPVHIAALRTNGFAVTGDGGAALYVRVVSEPSHAGKIQSNDGAWWELAVPGVSTRMLGTNHDGATNDAAAINAAVAAAADLAVPAILGPGDHAAASTLNLQGVVQGAGPHLTRITRTAGTAPGFTVGEDNVSISGVYLDMASSDGDRAGHGVRVNSDNFSMRNSVISDYGVFPGSSGGGTGVLVLNDDTGNPATRPRYPQLSDLHIIANTDSEVTIGWLFADCDYGFVSHVLAENAVGSAGIGYAHELKEDTRWCNLHALTATYSEAAVAYGQSSEGINGAKYNVAVGMLGDGVDYGVVTGDARGNVFVGGVFHSDNAPGSTPATAVYFSVNSDRNAAVAIAGFGDDAGQYAFQTQGSFNYASVLAYHTGNIARFHDGSTSNVVEVMHPGSRTSIIDAVVDDSGEATHGAGANVTYCHATGEYLGSLSGRFRWLLGNPGAAEGSADRFIMGRTANVVLSFATPDDVSSAAGIRHSVAGDGFTGGFLHILGGTRDDDSWVVQGWGQSTRFVFEKDYFRGNADNVINLGSPSNRFATVYAGTGTINTSDERSKKDIRDLTEAERNAAVRCKGLLRAFRFKDAVATKGDAARTHFGVIAQDVITAFAAEGLNAHNYGLLCYDEWEANDAVVDNEDGQVLTPAVEAGNAYGVRYDELLAFIIAAL